MAWCRLYVRMEKNKGLDQFNFQKGSQKMLKYSFALITILGIIAVGFVFYALGDGDEEDRIHFITHVHGSFNGKNLFPSHSHEVSGELDRRGNEPPERAVHRIVTAKQDKLDKHNAVRVRISHILDDSHTYFSYFKYVHSHRHRSHSVLHSHHHTGIVNGEHLYKNHDNDVLWP